MQTTIENLNARLNAMTVDELREFAAGVVKLLYLEHDEEHPTPVLDASKEWTGDTIELVAEEVSDAGLDPAAIELAAQRAQSASPRAKTSAAKLKEPVPLPDAANKRSGKVR